MNLKSIIQICFVLSLLAMPAVAAFDSGNTTMMPSFSTAWGLISSYLQTKITWLVAISVVFFVASVVIYLFLTGGLTVWSGTRGDVGGRASGISNIFLGVGVAFAVLLSISILFWLIN